MDIERKRNFIINFLYFSLILLMLYVCFKYLLAWTLPFIIAFCLVAILQPVINKIHLKTKINKNLLSVILTIISLFLLFTIIIYFFSSLIGVIPIITDIFSEIAKNYVPSIMNNILDFVDNIQNNFILKLTIPLEDMNFSIIVKNEIVKGISSLSSSLITWSGEKITQFPEFFVSIIITIIASIYTSLNFEKVILFFRNFIPEQQEKNIIQFAKNNGNKILKILKAYILLMSLTFVELAFGFTLLGLENAIFIAFLISIIDILPILGTGTVLIPWFIIAFICGNTKYGFGILLLYVIITFIRNMIEPKLVSEQIGLNPLATLITMYIGLKSIGIIGMFLFPIITMILHEYCLSKREVK